jgi:uncharacterized protein with PIN domain
MSESKASQDGDLPSFLLDGMLGTLARYLRMLGLDAEYCEGFGTEASIKRAVKEGRWFLTRKDVQEEAVRGTLFLQLSEDLPDRQVLQVLRSVPVQTSEARWFTRCLLCNRLLEDMTWKEVQGLVPEYIAQTHRRFRRCPCCARVFWPGSHSLHMRRTMERWLEESSRKGG